MGTRTTISNGEAWANAQGCSRGMCSPGVAAPWPIDRDRYGRIDYCDVGRVRLVRIRSNPLNVAQDDSDTPPFAADRYQILLQMSGRSEMEQGGHVVTLGPGDWMIHRSARPFRLSNLECSEHQMIILPRSELAGAGGDIDTLVHRRFLAGERRARLIGDVIAMAFETVTREYARGETELSEMAVHLSRLALIEAAALDGQTAPRSEVMFERVRSYVHRNLRDPALSVEGIAHALNCSKRYLHKAFSESDETVCEYILNRRLEKCYLELSNADAVERPIAQLAFDWGFVSPSYFGKAFGRRYGATPRSVRMAVRKD